MCLQDVDDLTGAVQEIARVLRGNGRVVIAITHPANTAGRFDGPRGDPGRPFVIAGSWFETRRLVDDVERDGLTIRFASVHRPLQTYVDALTENGFLVEKLAEVTEPDPTDVWYRMPLFLHIRAVRTT